MAGKFMGLPISQRTASKAMAVLVIILLGIAIYATRTMPKEHQDDKEWEIWRNADFSVSVVSLLFASFLLYGTISAFRLFVFFWIPWNVILVVFWIGFVVRKHDEFVEWERIFRIVAIVIMTIAEFPVCSYYSSLKERMQDPEAATVWTTKETDKAYKTLNEQSTSSLHSVFKAKLADENLGFQEETNVRIKTRGSTSSDESQGIEMKERDSEPEAEEPAPPAYESQIVSAEFSDSPVDRIEISQNDSSTATSSQNTEVSAGKDGSDVATNEADQANNESSTKADGSSTARYDDDVDSENVSDLTWPPAPAIKETGFESSKL